MTWTARAGGTQADITCPFCGLACDDLRLEGDGAQPTLVNACPTARARFTAALDTVDADRSRTPLIRGQQATLAEAVDEALSLLQGARLPLIAALATDVNGMRAALDLADRCGATLDHAGGDALFRNLLVVQDGGWMTCTLTEVRHRADLVVLLGTECHTRFPRLFERILAQQASPPAISAPPPRSDCDTASRARRAPRPGPAGRSRRRARARCGSRSGRSGARRRSWPRPR